MGREVSEWGEREGESGARKGKRSEVGRERRVSEWGERDWVSELGERRKSGARDGVSEWGER